MKTTSLPESRCFGCGGLLDEASSPSDQSPLDDRFQNITICVNCYAVGIIEKGLFRKPTPEEAVDLANDPEVKRMKFMLMLMHAAETRQ